jgi:hypothetical protein
MRSCLPLIPALLCVVALVGCASEPPREEEDVQSDTAAISGNQRTAPTSTEIDRPAYAPEGFYPENNVGEYYGPCGPLSATWLMTWYVGRGPGGSTTNQEAYNRVSDFAQGDRLLPGSSPSGLAYAINRMLERSWFADLARHRTGASIDDIRGLIAARKPVIVLIQWMDPGNTFPSMHYITLFGYRRVGDSYVYLHHDNGSFKEMAESELEPARDTQFYNRGIVWMDRAVSARLPAE